MSYKIGETIYGEGKITINKDSEAVEVIVRNAGDRTVQICSHYHFFEANNALKFQRDKAYGMRLDIPSGTAVRFEPGADKKVGLVPFKGKRELYGFDGAVMGKADDPQIKDKALSKYKEVL